MANQKISQFTERNATTIAKDDQFVVANTGSKDNYRLTFSNLSTRIANDFKGTNYMTALTADVATNKISIETLSTNTGILNDGLTNVSTLIFEDGYVSSAIKYLAIYNEYPAKNNSSLTGGYVYDLALSVHDLSNTIKTSSIGDISKLTKDMAQMKDISAGLSNQIKTLSTTIANEYDLGMIKTGYTPESTDKDKYAVNVNNEGKAYVTVPPSELNDERVNTLADISSYYCMTVELSGKKLQINVVDSVKNTLTEQIEQIAKFKVVSENEYYLTGGELSYLEDYVYKCISCEMDYDYNATELTGGIVKDYIDAKIGGAKTQEVVIGLQSIAADTIQRIKLDITVLEDYYDKNIKVNYIDLGKTSEKIDLYSYECHSYMRNNISKVALVIELKNNDTSELTTDSMTAYFTYS